MHKKSLFQGLLIPVLLHKSALHYYIDSLSAPSERGEILSLRYCLSVGHVT